MSLTPMHGSADYIWHGVDTYKLGCYLNDAYRYDPVTAGWRESMKLKRPFLIMELKPWIEAQVHRIRCIAGK